MGKRELIAFLNLSSWCLVMVERLFLAVPLGCLQFVIVVFPDHTHLLFLLVFFHFGFKFQPVSFKSLSSPFYEMSISGIFVVVFCCKSRMVSEGRPSAVFKSCTA